MFIETNSAPPRPAAEQSKDKIRAALDAVRQSFDPARAYLPLPGQSFSDMVVPAVAESLVTIDLFCTKLTEHADKHCPGHGASNGGHWPRRIRTELAVCAQQVQLFGQAHSLLTAEDKQRAFKSIYEAGARVFNSCVDACDFFCDPAGVAGS